MPAVRRVIDISIVMPSLNQAPFIERAVRSVLEQSVAALELVVMDGGSTDGTSAVLTRLRDEFGSRLRWYVEHDDGPAQAINRAVRHADGRILGWLNSDDEYAPGAIERALRRFAEEPWQVMLYGEAEHVDVDGRFIERYPSLRPDGLVERFRDGCFICQPSVFVRRFAWEQLGGLDESLRASFDFDLWVRLFDRFPMRIGFIEEVQARSRLHAGGITQRYRERVAREGIRLLARHFGSAPGHWLQTCFDDLLAAHPFHSGIDEPRVHFSALLDELGGQIDPDDRAFIASSLQQDVRLDLASECVAVDVSPDGWAPRVLELRYRQPPGGPMRLRLRGRLAAPDGRTQRLQPDGCGAGRSIEAPPGDVELDWNLPACDMTCEHRLQVVCDAPFIPAECESGSQDRRELAFRVLGVEVVPG